MMVLVLNGKWSQLMFLQNRKWKIMQWPLNAINIFENSAHITKGHICNICCLSTLLSVQGIQKCLKSI